MKYLFLVSDIFREEEFRSCFSRYYGYTPSKEQVLEAVNSPREKYKNELYYKLYKDPKVALQQAKRNGRAVCMVGIDDKTSTSNNTFTVENEQYEFILLKPHLTLLFLEAYVPNANKTYVFNTIDEKTYPEYFHSQWNLGFHENSQIFATQGAKHLFSSYQNDWMFTWRHNRPYAKQLAAMITLSTTPKQLLKRLEQKKEAYIQDNPTIKRDGDFFKMVDYAIARLKTGQKWTAKQLNDTRAEVDADRTIEGTLLRGARELKNLAVQGADVVNNTLRATRRHHQGR